MSEELIWNYSNDLREKHGYSRNYLVSHRSDVRGFLRWLAAQQLTLNQAKPQIVQDYLRFYRSSHKNIRSLYGALAVLKRFARFAMDKGLLTQDPTAGVYCTWLDAPDGFFNYQGILRKIYNRPAAMAKYRMPLFEPYLEEYLNGLVERRHPQLTLLGFLPPLRYFHLYLVHRGITCVLDVRLGIFRDYLRDFEAHFKRRHRHTWTHDYRRHVRRQVRNLLIFAFQKQGKDFQPPPRLRNSQTLPTDLLYQFLDFCRDHKGIQEGTIAGWKHILLRFRRFLERRNVPRIEKVTPGDLDAFLLALTKRMQPKTVNSHIAAIRAFFTYLFLHERFPFDMTRCIEYPCQFSRSRYPKYLPWPKIQAVLAGIDRSTALGKRDYALLSMLSCHGMRPGEVARLHLAEINWEDSSITLRKRKSGIAANLPLAAPAKQALQDYLPTRPASTLPNLFLNHRAPFGPFGPASLRWVAAKYLRRSLGDSLPYYGGYIFRHSFAKAMLDRGASLLSIGTMLGHRRLNSTLVYTQIDTKGLREASDNYSDLL